MKIPRTLVAIGYLSGPAACAWLSSWGTPIVLLWVMLSVMLAFGGLFFYAVRTPIKAQRVAAFLGLAVLEVGLLWAGLLSGRALFLRHVIGSLDEYQRVADAQLSRLSSQDVPKRVTQPNPHPDLAWAEAVRFADGGTVVRLTFRHSPRHVILQLASNHTLPPHDEAGLCLESVSGAWQWYVAC